MRVLITGIPCVGKSTIGALLAAKLGYHFIDFDFYIEEKMGDSIERIQNRFFTNQGFRDAAKPFFAEALNEYRKNLIIAMPPSGLFREYSSILKKHHPDVIKVVIKDKRINILNRLVFYDEDTKLIEDYGVDDSNRDYYYDDIQKDVAYYYNSYRKADIQFQLNGMNAEEGADALANCLSDYLKRKGNIYHDLSLPDKG